MEITASAVEEPLAASPLSNPQAGPAAEPGAQAARPVRDRIPLTTFAAPFGLGGLAEAWTAGGEALHLSPAIAWGLWVLAAVVWLWVLTAHVVRGIRTRLSLRAQLRHPAQGPIAALAPTMGMLLAAQLHRWSPLGGRVLLLASLAVALAFAAWLIAGWFDGRLKLADVHGGYLLPTVAAGFVGGESAAVNGLPGLGWAAFGVGVFFAIVMTAVVVLRLMLESPLPAPLVPSMAILAAPPAVGGLAWFALTGERADTVAIAFAGVGALMVAVQLALLPRYLRLGFTLGFWSFTFTAGAIVADTIIWLGLGAVPGAAVISAVLLAAVTVLIGGIGIRSLLALRR